MFDWKDALNYNPVVWKAKAIKLAWKGGVLALMLTLAYCKGVSNTNADWEGKIASQKQAVAEVQRDNAVDAGKRFGIYTRTQAELDTAVEKVKRDLHDYYAANPITREVLKTKLVQVPGKEEYVYVPIGTCPNDFFGPDELRLWNLGAKGYDPDPTDTK